MRCKALQVGVSAAAAAAEKRYGAFFFSCFLFACFYSVEKTGRTSSSAAAASCKYLVAKCGGGGRQNANVLLSGFCTGLPSSLRSTYRDGERRGGMWTTVGQWSPIHSPLKISELSSGTADAPSLFSAQTAQPMSRSDGQCLTNFPPAKEDREGEGIRLFLALPLSARLSVCLSG